VTVPEPGRAPRTPATGQVFARALAVLVSLVVIGWLALGLDQARVEDRAGELAAQAVAEDARERAGDVLARLEERRPFLPETGSMLVEARLLFALGRPEPAARILERLVALEPENHAAWGALAFVSAATDRDLSERAHRRLAELDPLGAEQP
jgi:predicted Zn-dependent protease